MKKFIIITTCLLLVGCQQPLGQELFFEEVPMKWKSSYETIKFDTDDGDLALDEYAINSDNSWYIRDIPKANGQFIVTENKDNIIGKKKVNIVCERCMYYSEFYNIKGETERILYNKIDYDKLRTEKNVIQPSKKELISFLQPKNANAAIAYDNTSNDGSPASVSSVSWSHTVNSGADDFLFVGASGYDTTEADCEGSSATYNSDSMIKVIANISNSTYCRSTAFQLANPDDGSAYTVSITLGGTCTEQGAGAISFTGVDQSSPVEVSDERAAQSASTNMSENSETITDNAWLVAIGCTTESDYAGVNPGTGTTELWQTGMSTADANTVGGYEGPITPPADTTINWTWTGNEYWAIVVIGIKPAGGAPPPAGAVNKQHIYWFD